MFTPRASLTTLLESGRLDELLANARKLAHVAPPVSPAPTTELPAVDRVLMEAKAAAGDLRGLVAERAALRAEKVAAVLHLGRVASRLLA